MREIVACPSCHARLRLPDEPPPGGMTCPRCLAQVPYEFPTVIQAAPIHAPAVPPAAIQTAPTEPEPEPRRSSKCPYCGKQVDPEWLFCPGCEEPLRSSRTGSRNNGVDKDVKRDGKAVNVILILMGIMGGIGTLWYFAAAIGAPQSQQMVLSGVAFFLFLALLSTAIMFYRTRHEPSKRGIGRVLASTLMMIGILMTVGCSVALAMVITIFVVCFSQGFKL
jgi:hypothetical protein